MVNVLIIPTSGLMEFNASAAAGGASGTLDNTYANAVRMDISNSATLRVLGKNATNNERLVVSGTNGVVLKVRDVSAAGSASASVETPIMSATYVSAGTVSATNYLNLPVLGEGQFVELSGDTMTGRLILSGSTSGNELLTVSGSATVSGQISSITVSAVSARFTDLSATNISALTNIRGGNVSATTVTALNNINASSFVATSAFQGPTVSATNISGITEVSSPSIRGGSVSAATVSAVNNMNASSFVGTSAVSTPSAYHTTLSSNSISSTNVTALNNINASSFVAVSAFQGAIVSATNISGITEVSSPSIRGGSVSAATVSAVNNMNASSFVAVSAFQGAIVSATNISGITEVSSPSIRGGSVSAATVSALNNMNASSFVGTSAVSTPSAYHTTLSSNSISATNVTALNNINASSFIAVSAFQGAVVSATNISGITEVSSPSIRGGSVSAATVSALNNMNASSFVGTSAVSTPSAYHTTLSSNSISSTNVTALNNMNASSFVAVSAVQAPTVSATSAIGVNGIFPTVSANSIQVTAINAGTVSGVQGTDISIQITTVGVGTLTLSSAQTNVSGPLSVNGHFAATSKAFLIDHPTPAKKAAGMKLQYACLEGPENGVYVRGKADAAKADHIILPDYWIDLVHADSITVQITPTNPEQKLYVEKIEDNKVYIKDTMVGGDGLTKSEYFYIVHGERKDIDHLTIEY